MKVKMNLPLVAYKEMLHEVDVPDDFDFSTGKSESCPHFDLMDALQAIPDSTWGNDGAKWSVEVYSIHDFSILVQSN